MESIDPACNELKHRYDQCFNQWYLEHFLKNSTQDPCQELFSIYNTCVKKAIQAQNKEKELAEAQKENLAFFKSIPKNP